MTLSPRLGAAGIIILWQFKSPLLTLIFISVALFFQTIALLSSTEGAEDSVADETNPPVNDSHLDVSPVNHYDSGSRNVNQ